MSYILTPLVRIFGWRYSRDGKNGETIALSNFCRNLCNLYSLHRTFFDPRITNRLRPRYLDSFDPVFDIDLTEAITEEATTIKMLRPYSLVLEPGQVLFVPAGSPHRVENLENSVAVSGNFVNDSNADEAAQHLIRNALLDHRAGDLLREWLHRGLIK